MNAVGSRAAALAWHRWVGLSLTLFLVVAGATGACLAFYEELDGWFASRLHAVSDAPPLDALELDRRARAQLPADATLDFLPLALEPGRPAVFFVGRADATADDEFFFDPSSGKLLGSRHWGAVPTRAEELMPFLYRLHYSLGLESVGETVMGLVALAWTIDCFIAFALTFPPRRKERTGARAWLKRWGPSWQFKWGTPFTAWFTWHRASGLWAWAMLFVFAWSAVGLNLTAVYHPVMKTLLGYEERADQRLPLVEPGARMPMPAALLRARALMAEQANAAGLTVLAERHLTYLPRKNAYGYRVQTSADLSKRFASTNVWFDATDGRLLAFQPPTGENAGRTVSTWLAQLHFGSVDALGWPLRALVSLMGLAVVGLSVSGAWLWLKRRQRERRATETSPTAEAAQPVNS